jgi:membrane-bound lytic murein transglycosylase D
MNRRFIFGAAIFVAAIALSVFAQDEDKKVTVPNAEQNPMQRGLEPAESASKPHLTEEVVDKVGGTNSEAEEAVAPNPNEKERKWVAPQYAKQLESSQRPLGYDENTFAIPEGLKERVQFWLDIYTKYTTDQGVLHDSLHVGVVYEPVDFTAIQKDASLNDRQKSKARRKLVEDKKKEIKDRLLALEKLSTTEGFDPKTLAGEDLRYWQMFEKIDEEKKFKASSEKGRLRFQLGQKDRFQQGIYYSGRYLQEMEKIFAEAGLPIELTRLPFVESSFNVMARSRVGASGIWQFMRYTGKKFMRIHSSADERNDPIRATRAAARLLKLNYNMLQKWPLAITGYNHGPAGVQRMVQKFKTDDITALVDERHKRFGFASANFYASFLAAVHAEKDAKKYFGEVFWDGTVPAAEIKPKNRVNRKMLLSWFGGNETRARDLNPHLTRTFWSGHGALTEKDFLRVPNNKLKIALAEIEKPPVIKAGRSAGSDKVVAGTESYVIGQGETLSEIANQMGISINRLMDLNDIENPRRIRAGQKILVPRTGAE